MRLHTPNCFSKLAAFLYIIKTVLLFAAGISYNPLWSRARLLTFTCKSSPKLFVSDLWMLQCSIVKAVYTVDDRSGLSHRKWDRLPMHCQGPTDGFDYEQHKLVNQSSHTWFGMRETQLPSKDRNLSTATASAQAANRTLLFLARTAAWLRTSGALPSVMTATQPCPRS